ncbi:MAG TPA: hypothetical protein VNS60_00095 [Solirubrobacterales bacterium]|nr:hypothetical protein [Solirubrobacterales bacterium]
MASSNVGGVVYRTRSQLIGGIAIVLVANLIALGRVLGNLHHSSTAVVGVVFSVVFSAVGGRLAWSGVVTSRDGIHVANFLSSFDLRWGEIETFAIGRWKFLPFVCLIYMKNGDVKHAFGIEESTQRPDGSAEHMADELNKELARGLSARPELQTVRSDLLHPSRNE